MSDVVQALRNSELLATLDDAVLAWLADHTDRVELRDGELLVEEGAPSDALFVLEEGTLAVTMQSPAGPHEVNVVQAGEVVGESALVVGGRRTASLVARGPVSALRLPRASFDELLSTHSTVRAKVAELVARRLRATNLVEPLRRALGDNDALVGELVEQASWVRLERGEVLIAEGAPASGWFVLISGELAVIEGEGTKARTLRHLERGDVFGEMALIRKTVRSATIVARRASWVAQFDAELFETKILGQLPPLKHLLGVLADRLAHAYERPPNQFVWTVLGREPGVAARQLADQLATALSPLSCLVVTPELLAEAAVLGSARDLPPDHPGWLRFDAWFETQRRAFDVVLLVADPDDHGWTWSAVDHSDRVLLLADADSDPTPRPVEARLFAERDAWRPPCWLVLMHPADRASPSCTSRWWSGRDVAEHAHLREGHDRDLRRLTRRLLGQMTGLALSGGGARGFAHLGIAGALAQRGIEVDMVAGTSAGAMAAALISLDRPPAELAQRGVAGVAAQGNPFGEFELPAVALVRSRRLERGLQATFGDLDIEDTWIPLRIVVTSLTDARRVVFDRGPIWRRALASSSPPGAMRPVIEGDQLLCDGGLVDNLPVSVLVEADCDVSIASYIGDGAQLTAPRAGFPSAWRLLLDRVLGRHASGDVPMLLTLLLQATTVASDARLEEARAAADLFFEPQLGEFSITDFTRAPEMLEVAQAYALKVLDDWQGRGP